MSLATRLAMATDGFRGGEGGGTTIVQAPTAYRARLAVVDSDAALSALVSTTDIDTLHASTTAAAVTTRITVNV